MDSELQLHTRGTGVRFAVHVKPRSSRSQLLRIRAGALDIALKAPPVDGAANTELVKLLAKVLAIPRTSVNIASGTSSRKKLIDIDPIERCEMLNRLTASLSS